MHLIENLCLDVIFDLYHCKTVIKKCTQIAKIEVYYKQFKGHVLDNI